MNLNPELLSFIRKNLVLLAGFIVVLAVAIWFSVHVILHALYFNDPRNVDVDLRPWMTPRYIVLTYDLPRPFVLDMLELDPALDKGVRLGRIAQQRGVSMSDLTEQVRTAAAAYREEQQ
ncbi:MAG: hypothetical protein AAF404_18795 [Pseudomonadota bacterium]